MENWQNNWQTNYTGCKALSPQDADLVAASFNGKYRLRDRAIWLTGVYTGLRISEILSLNIGDVVDGSIFRNTVTVKKAFMKGKKESRTIPLHFRAQSAIRELVESLPPQSRSEKTPLFRSQGTEKRLSSRMYSLQLKSAARAAGISCDNLSTHTMRKSFASRMWTSSYIGKDLAKMAQLLGHKDPSNTLRYIQFLDNSLTEAVLA